MDIYATKDGGPLGGRSIYGSRRFEIKHMCGVCGVIVHVMVKMLEVLTSTEIMSLRQRNNTCSTHATLALLYL